MDWGMIRYKTNPCQWFLRCNSSIFKRKKSSHVVPQRIRGSIFFFRPAPGQSGPAVATMKNHPLLNPLLLALVLVGTPFFFLGGPGYHGARSFQAAWDLGHILYFLLLSCWFHRLLAARVAWSSGRLLAVIFTVVLVFGLTVEVLQMVVGGRSPDPLDVLRDLEGCLLAFAFCCRPPLPPGNSLRLFRVLVLILLALASWPLTRALIDERLAARQFPVLADFETPFELDRWVNPQQLDLETDRVRHGARATRVQLSTNKYSGIALFHFPGDWRGYRSLRFSVYCPQAGGLILNSRIHDRHHKMQEFSDRFNQQFTLQQGWNDLVISLDKVREAPRGRPMDLAHIEGFGLFVIQQARPMEIWLDYVYLAP